VLLVVLFAGGLTVLLGGWFFLLLRRKPAQLKPRRLGRIVRRSWRRLRVDWVGSSLSGLQIAGGVFVVILLTSWGNGVQEKVTRELNGLGPHQGASRCICCTFYGYESTGKN
jgi:hypothetical protein